MTLHKPEITWYGTGGSNMLNADKLKPLLNKHIILYPDVGMFGKWSEIMDRAKSQYRNINIDISTECELWHEQGFIKEGEDIADYWLKILKWSHKNQKFERQEIVPVN